MQGKLRTQIETERAVAAENTRIRQALDKVSTSVVLADAQLPDHLSERDRAVDVRAQPARDPQDACRASTPQRLRGSSLDVAVDRSRSTAPRARHSRRLGYAGAHARRLHLPHRRQPGARRQGRAHRHGRGMDRPHAGSRRREGDAEHALRRASAATSASASTCTARRASSRR